MKIIEALNVSGLQITGTSVTYLEKFNLLKQIHETIIKPFLVACPNVEYVSELEEVPESGNCYFKSHYILNGMSDHYLCIKIEMGTNGNGSLKISATSSIEDYSIYFDPGGSANAVFSSDSTTNKSHFSGYIHAIIDDDHNLLAISHWMNATGNGSNIEWVVADADQASGKNMLINIKQNTSDGYAVIEGETNKLNMSRVENTYNTLIPGKVIIKNKEIHLNNVFIAATTSIKYLISTELGTMTNKSLMKIMVNNEELVQLNNNYWI